jgi:hypothetical protein
VWGAVCRSAASEASPGASAQWAEWAARPQPIGPYSPVPLLPIAGFDAALADPFAADVDVDDARAPWHLVPGLLDNQGEVKVAARVMASCAQCLVSS